jgi:hypothetical protein
MNAMMNDIGSVHSLEEHLNQSAAELIDMSFYEVRSLSLSLSLSHYRLALDALTLDSAQLVCWCLWK